MALRVRTRIPADDPYAHSKTEKQWHKEHRAIIDPVRTGECMWTNQFCQVWTDYYIYEDTRPATPDELQAWQEEKRQYCRQQYQLRKRRKQEKIEKEKAEEERARSERNNLVQRIHRFDGVSPTHLLCLDTETTGLTDTDEIVQLSIIDGNGSVLFNEYIKPQATQEWPEAEAIHHISPAMVADKLTISDHKETIESILAAGEVVIGYNLDFDLSFLRLAGIQIPQQIGTFDVMAEFAEIYGQWDPYHSNYRWQKLSVCAEYFGYTGMSFHNSLDDCCATLHCYKAMTELNFESNTNLAEK